MTEEEVKMLALRATDSYFNSYKQEMSKDPELYAATYAEVYASMLETLKVRFLERKESGLAATLK